MRSLLRFIVIALIVTACGDGRLSPQGGTITSVQPTSGGGLTGGGITGTVSLGLKTSCGSTQVLKWDGDSWECGDVTVFSTNNVVPKGNGTGLVASVIVDDTATVRFGNGPYVPSSSPGSLNYDYLSDSDTTGWVNKRGFANGTTRFRNLSIGDGKDTALAHFVASTAQLGIGLTGPDANTKVHIRTTASTALAAIGGNALTMEAASAVYMTLKADASADKGILFSNASNAADGGIIYDNSTAGARSMDFRTGGNTSRMVILSNGSINMKRNVGSGTPFSSGQYTLSLIDTTALAAGNGGELRFEGVITGSTTTIGAAIRAVKVDANSNDEDFDLLFGTRLDNSSNVTEVLRLRNTGSMIVKGGNTNTPSANGIAGLELYTGREGNGSLNTNQTVADIAFQWGGASGGYRHWIQTRHSATATSNSMRFYVNSGASAEISSAPGTGNAQVLDLYGDASARFYNRVAVNNAVVSTSTMYVNAIAGSKGIYAQNQNTGQTTGTPMVYGDMGGSFDTTGGIIAIAGVEGSCSSTRSAGSSALGCIGVIARAAGGTSANGLYATFDGLISSSPGIVGVSVQADRGVFHVGGNGAMFSNGLSAGAGPIESAPVYELADVFMAGRVRRNALKNSDELTDGGSGTDLFQQVESGSTLAYTTSSQTSPRNVTENVGQLTCTDGGTACSVGGSDYRYEATSASHGVSDVRSLPWSASGWFKLASGGDVDAELKVARDSDADITTATCRISSSFWTRCQVAKLFGSSSQADNSEVTWYFVPKTTVAVYMFGAQLERGDMRSQYQENNATLATGSSSTDAAVWTNDLRIGGTMQNPAVRFSGATISGSTLTFGQSVVLNGNVTVGSGSLVQIGSATSFVNGNLTSFDAGIKVETYKGKHLEWQEEYLNPNNAFLIGLTGQAGFASTTGTGALINMGTVNTTTRPGIGEYRTGSTTTGRAAIIGAGPSAGQFDFTAGNWYFQQVVGFPTLSTSGEEYTYLAGFGDTNTVNQTDGCFFLYDRGNVATSGPNAGNADKWSAWCVDSGVVTAVILDGTTQGGIVTVDSPVAALTLPDTNIYNLEIVMTANTQAVFKINGTTRATITTNIPDATEYTDFRTQILKSAGSTSRLAHADYLRYYVDLTSVRSP